MKISQLNNLQVDFGSKRLYSAKLCEYFNTNGIIKHKDVFISQINNADLEKLSRQEYEKIKEGYGINILGKILQLAAGEHNHSGYGFFAIEAPSKNKNSILGLAMVSKEDFETYIDFIQSYNTTQTSRIRGIGSCLIYGIIESFARKGQSPKIRLDSTYSAKDFYKKLGFKQTFKKSYCFELKKKNYKKVKPLIREKYFIRKLKEK